MLNLQNTKLYGMTLLAVQLAPLIFVPSVAHARCLATPLPDAIVFGLYGLAVAVFLLPALCGTILLEVYRRFKNKGQSDAGESVLPQKLPTVVSWIALFFLTGGFLGRFVLPRPLVLLWLEPDWAIALILLMVMLVAAFGKKLVKVAKERIFLRLVLLLLAVGLNTPPSVIDCICGPGKTAATYPCGGCKCVDIGSTEAITGRACLTATTADGETVTYCD